MIWKTILLAGLLCLLSTKLIGVSVGQELPLAVQVVACESSGRAYIWGDDRRSFGIAQFQKSTFNWMKHKARIESLKYRSPVDQLVLLNWAISHNMGHYWTCYRKIERGHWKISKALVLKMRRNKYIQFVYGSQCMTEEKTEAPKAEAEQQYCPRCGETMISHPSDVVFGFKFGIMAVLVDKPVEVKYCEHCKTTVLVDDEEESRIIKVNP